MSVVGAGPAGLMAAEVLARGGATVTVYDQMPSIGRKFLLAGRGGLNLTHVEGLDVFIGRYAGGAPSLREAIAAFPPEALRAWCEGLGQRTFVGSSGRVFPAAFKTSPLLRAWLARLAVQGVTLQPRHRWVGFTPLGARFETPSGDVEIACDAFVLAFGGASWPRLGSDGAWVAPFMAAGVAVSPLGPSNCGLAVPWSDVFRDRFEGQPLKAVAVTISGRTARGDAVVTRSGLEGGPIYALSGPVRDALARGEAATLAVDLRPDLPHAALAARLAERGRGKPSLATGLRKALRLSPVAIGLLHEALPGGGVGRLTPTALATLIRGVPVRVEGVASLERAISTAGGVAWSELDADFMLRRRPGVFIAGEMLDWEAPTGGYLLQACFATGAAAGRGALAYLKRSPPARSAPG